MPSGFFTTDIPLVMPELSTDHFAPESDSGASPQYDLGVLFVHGIGSQAVGTTLADFGTPVVEWLQSAAANAGRKVELGRTKLVPDGSEPASSEIIFSSDARHHRWLMAESWWAQSFAMASFRDVAGWSLLILPWTVGTHFARRLILLHAEKRVVGRINAGAALVASLLLSPVALLALALLLVLGRLPWPPVQSAVAKIQLALASTIGDSYLLVTRPIEAAAIRTRLRRDLTWMEARCRRVAVVAHSQGAAIACQVLSDWPSQRLPHERLLITFGSGLRKLEEIDAARRQGRVLQGAMWTVAGQCLTGLAIGLVPQVAYDVHLGLASPASLATLLVVAVVGATIATAGIQDFLHATAPVRLQIMTAYLAFKGVLHWEDVYASADPVPNGRLRDDDKTPPTSTEVVNLGSLFRDHTTYWQNRDEFVSIVGEKLLNLDGAGLLGPDYPAHLAFVRAQRRIRVGVLRWLHWATAACVVALVVGYRADWLTVAAWVSHWALGWVSELVGYTLPAQPIPELQVWRRSVGWLAVVAVWSWLTRALWNLWNNAAMDDARRAVYRVREPLALSLTLFVQLFVTSFALVSPRRAFIVAMSGVVALVVGTTVAQGRHRAPSSSSTPSSIALPGSLVVRNALVKLGVAAITMIGAPLAFIAGARSVQEFLEPRMGVRASWTVAALVLVAALPMLVVAARGIIASFLAQDDTGRTVGTAIAHEQEAGPPSEAGAGRENVT